MKKVLLVALVHHNADKLTRLIWSAHSQIQANLQVAGLVVCNTTNPAFVSEARDVATRFGWMFQQTESNGMPGKGKNSALELFLQTSGFDYMFLMDGDDFLYPTAFGQIEQLTRVGSDVIGLLTNDIIETQVLEGQSHIPISGGKYLYSWFDEQVRWPCLESQKPRLDLSKPLGEQNTPDRIVLFSRKAAEMLRCSEKLPVYEDYVLSLRARIAMLRGELTYTHCGTTYLYVYDKTDSTSVCKEFDRTHNGNWSAYDSTFREELGEDLSQLLQTQAHDVPFVQINHPTEFTTRNKLQFLSYVLSISTWQQPNINIQSK